MEHLLISNGRHLHQANLFGVKKILRNVLALQQSIKTITNKQKHTEFERAKRYYSLFFMSPPVGFPIDSTSYIAHLHFSGYAG
jgi:exocyst complex component 4